MKNRNVKTIGMVLGAILLLGVIAFAQKKVKNENEIPKAVKECFKKNFPTAEKIKWEKEDVNFEAGFVVNKQEQSALISGAGKLLETETEIEVAKLPKLVTDYVSANYASKKIKEAAIIKDAKGITTYEAEIKGMDLIFDQQGNFIKVVSLKKEVKK